MVSKEQSQLSSSHIDRRQLVAPKSFRRKTLDGWKGGTGVRMTGRAVAELREWIELKLNHTEGKMWTGKRTCMLTLSIERLYRNSTSGQLPEGQLVSVNSGYS